MCGICGEFKFVRKDFDLSKHDNLMNSIASRGSDSKGTFIDKDVFLGHHRLAIIDTSDKSNQPMHIGEHIIVFNGVIFNYKCLRKELINKGHIFRSSGDTEVLLRSYIEYGNECVRHLDGVFAFCIYNSKKKTFFLARDRIGIKPLYYSIQESEFYFSSHMKGIIQNLKSKEINPVALNYQFTLHSVVPAPHTIIKDIHKLEPGHTLSIDKSGNIYKRKYYDVNDIGLVNYKHDDIVDRISILIDSAVKKRLNVADVPVGVLLSGGLDSSLITAISKKYINNLSTYSIGFNTIDEEEGNEFFYSDIVSKDLNTIHQKYQITNDELLTNLDNVIANMSEPMFSQDSSAFFLLAKNVSQSSKVVMSGQGADEVFGGYFWYRKIMNEKKLNEIETLSKYYFDRTFDNYKIAINPDLVSNNYAYNDIKSKLDEMDSSLSTLDKIFRLELSLFIIDDPVKRVDNMTMSHALEARVPFLDIDLINFMLSISANLKISKGEKYLLKEISKGFLDDNIIYRKKFYFPVPPLKIIEEKFLHYCQKILNCEQANERKLFNKKYINTLLNEPNSHFTNLKGNELWHFTLLERWLQLNIEQ